MRYDPTVRLRDAIEMLAESGVDTLGPTTWADLGCGTGTFTLALADRLSPGSTIHAMDRDGSVLRRIPPEHKGVRIATHRGEFTKEEWPFDNLDGVLMANSLHYVDNQAAFIRRCERRMTMPRRFLIVEYDTDESSRWVPHGRCYPVWPGDLRHKGRAFRPPAESGARPHWMEAVARAIDACTPGSA